MHRNLTTLAGLVSTLILAALAFTGTVSAGQPNCRPPSPAAGIHISFCADKTTALHWVSPGGDAYTIFFCAKVMNSGTYVPDGTQVDSYTQYGSTFDFLLPGDPWAHYTAGGQVCWQMTANQPSTWSLAVKVGGVWSGAITVNYT